MHYFACFTANNAFSELVPHKMHVMCPFLDITESSKLHHSNCPDVDYGPKYQAK